MNLLAFKDATSPLKNMTMLTYLGPDINDFTATAEYLTIILLSFLELLLDSAFKSLLSSFHFKDFS